MEKNNKKLIVVLGMHRSGTSAVSRSLVVLGVDLGSSLIGPNDHNLKGYWEDLDINQLNTEMLHFLKKDWYFLAPIQKADIDLLNGSGYLLRAVELLVKKTKGRSTFGFKDPRVTQLLPFWKQAFKHAEIKVNYLLVTRNPLSVCLSLKERDGFDFEKSFLMWLHYAVNSINLTEDESRVFIDFDILMKSPEKQLERVSKAFHLHIDEIELETYCKEFLDHNLRHSVFQLKDLHLGGSVPELVSEVYDRVLKISQGEKQEADLNLCAKRWHQELERLYPAFGLVDKLETKIVNKEASLRKEGEENASRMQVLKSEIADRDTRIQSLTEQLSERDAHMQALSDQAAERDARMQALSDQAAERDARVRVLTDQLASRDKQVQAVTAQLDLAKLQTEQLQQTAPVKLLILYRRILDRVFRPGSRTRLGYDLFAKSIKTIVFDGPRAFWRKAKEWRLARRRLREVVPSSLHQPGQVSAAAGNPAQLGYAQVYQEAVKLSASQPSQSFVPITEKNYSAAEAKTKAIAFYLPQFHPIPENDEWWGKGFTEWTNVSKALPQFVGHYQPHLPGELGFYDLRVPEVMRRQVELARKYGIYGFCFYYYWFNGKRLLERPLEQYIADKEIDFPFCICWANENWSRRWDGQDQDVLIGQIHSAERDWAFIQDVTPIFQHPRYIRIEGKPLLVVYRAHLLPEVLVTANRWREFCRNKGIGEIYLVAAQTFGFTDPTLIGFDAAVEFPPHGMGGSRVRNITGDVDIINSEFSGYVMDYISAVAGSISLEPNKFTLFKTVMPGWDNTPRRGANGGLVFHKSSPGLYGVWLSKAIEYVTKNNSPEKQYVFINAWNEWAEGAHLEPDRKYGYAFLQQTADALSGINNESFEGERTGELSLVVNLSGNGSKGLERAPAPYLSPIIVFQMGKVGSMTVVKSLRKWFHENRLFTPIHHVHLLANLDEERKIILKERKDPSEGLEHLLTASSIRKIIEERIDREWNIISLTRDPVARNISFFFQTIKDYIPEWEDLVNGENIDLDELQEIFLSIKSIHAFPETWFDKQLKEVTGFDIYSEPFPASLGYKIYKPTKRFNILVMRVEDMNKILRKAMSEFVGIENADMVNDNVSGEKLYHELYTKFKKLPLPRNYIDQIYSSKYVKHFYTADEIDRFRNKWLEPNFAKNSVPPAKAISRLTEKMRGLDDESWLNLLIRSTSESRIEGVEFPGFPSAELQSTFVGSANERTLREASKFYTLVKKSARQLGKPLEKESRILDFGCGWGRFTRFFWKDVDESNLFGCDTNKMIVDICRSLNVPGQIDLISPHGTLPYEDNYFDVIVAHSVFTHLPEMLHINWMQELARVARPDCVFCLTLEPRRFIDFIANLPPKPESKWHEMLLKHKPLVNNFYKDFDAGRFVFMPTNPGLESIYGDAVVPFSYIKAMWRKHFEIKTYLDDPDQFSQAVLIAQRKTAA